MRGAVVESDQAGEKSSAALLVRRVAAPPSALTT
jgi:hypothetical protein